MYLLCTDVGPVHPTDFMRTRRRPQQEVGPATADGPVTVGGTLSVEAERVLRRVERNLIALICTVPMGEIEDILPSMQPHVVWVPRTWIQHFWHLANAIIHYGRANRPRA
jgi:hypothetical protein